MKNPFALYFIYHTQLSPQEIREKIQKLISEKDFFGIPLYKGKTGDFSFDFKKMKPSRAGGLPPWVNAEYELVQPEKTKLALLIKPNIAPFIALLIILGFLVYMVFAPTVNINGHPGSTWDRVEFALITFMFFTFIMGVITYLPTYLIRQQLLNLLNLKEGPEIKFEKKVARTQLPYMHIFDETDMFFLGHMYEDAYLVERTNGKEILIDSFYGDPKCGLISKNNEWAIIAGEHIAIWRKNKIIKIDLEEVRWVHSVRIKDDSTVEILIDPWCLNSAIWELDINTLKLKKIRDFNDYKQREYSEDIEW